MAERKEEKARVVQGFLERQKSQESQRQRSIEAMKEKIFVAQTSSLKEQQKLTAPPRPRFGSSGRRGEEPGSKNTE